MASAAASAVLLVAVLSLLSSTATARPGHPFHPCNTLVVSYSFSSGDPLAADGDALSRPTAFFSVYRVIDLRRPIRIPRLVRIHRPAGVVPADPSAAAGRSAAGFGLGSLQERAKDVLVVVVALLFGVGCGALTAATMYLAWSLVTNRYEICGSDAYEEEYDVVESPKKAGYVKIPAAEPTPAAKEGYEGK